MKTRRTLTCILLIMGAIFLCAPSVNAQSKSVKSKPRATKTKVVVPKQQRPATPSPVDAKERTIKDLLYFPYSCLPANVSNAEEAQNMLTNYFGSCERVDNVYYGLHRNDSFDYTYRGVPIGLTFYDWFDKCAFLPEMLRRATQGPQGVIPMTRTYFSPVGKPEDLKVVMRYFQENYFMEGLAQRNPEIIYKYPYDRPHNYLLTAIEPYFDLYRATGAKKYLDAVEGAWDLFHDNWEMTGGEMSINEGTFVYEPRSYYLHLEAGELCGNVFWIKLNQRFHNLRPEEEKYQAEIEKSIYNVAIANQYGAEGIRYFAKLDGHKDDPHRHGSLPAMNTCCEGQGTRLYGSLPEYIYSFAKDGIYINQYSASEVSMPVGSKALKLKMDTQFPYGMEVSIAVENTQPVDADIHVRIPSWAAKSVAVRVNGEITGEGKPGSYCTLHRQWKAGDKIEFVLPADFRLTLYEGKEPGFEHDHYALEYGPILMAAVGVKAKKEIEIKADAQTLTDKLRPVEGKPLHFAVEGDEEIEYWPYFEVKDESFSCFPKLAGE